MRLSSNIDNIEISGIRKFYNKVAKIEGAISLTLGEPDFKIPEEIKEAMKKSLDEDRTTYTPNAGIEELREEISKYLKSLNISFSSKEICVTVGGSEGLLSTFTGILNPGDKVLIPSIAYPAYENCVKILGGEVINYSIKEDLSIDMEQLERVIEKECPKVIVVSYPSNPTGQLLTKDQCDRLFNILKDKDVLIVSDEIYSSIVFGEFNSISQYGKLKDKLILIGGFSKMFSMTGIRIGYVCAAECILNSIIKVHQYNVSCAPSIGQYGALEGLKKSMYHIEHIKSDLKIRRDYVYDRLVSMGLEAIRPEGAFYIFPCIKSFGFSSEDFCDKLLEDTKVAVVPGTAFGKGGEGYVRISYCYSMEDLKLSLDLMEQWLNQIKLN
ncbi:aspartate aminotransferase [Clostridium sulfidigenes]|uniref:Aminotransferase n=1 Tax=Clostridium sulfidigenes TaxID=318464 RepID=A0A084JB03_9CLOT|nr:aminotransferase class I/II-fold pyridoxal phosphate-dependent enzyme [Clostridium sulfidigenes]KEZ86137.1 aspartate aminotransferase [Clostridium sulfidigenes]